MNEIELKLNKISKPPSSTEDSNDFVRPYANLSNYSNSLVNGDKNLNDQIDNIGLQIQGNFLRTNLGWKNCLLLP